MGKNKSPGGANRPTTKRDLRTTPGWAAKSRVPAKTDAARQNPGCLQHPKGTTEPPSTATEDDNLQNLEFSQEDEFAMDELRLELFRRKELAIIELQKMVAASQKGEVAPKKRK